MIANVRFTVDGSSNSSSSADLWQADRFEFIVIPDRDSFSGVRPTTSGETWVGYVLVPASHWARLPAQRLIGKRTARKYLRSLPLFLSLPFLKEYFINIPLFIRYGYVAVEISCSFGAVVMQVYCQIDGRLDLHVMEVGLVWGCSKVECGALSSKWTSCLRRSTYKVG